MSNVVACYLSTNFPQSKRVMLVAFFPHLSSFFSTEKGVRFKLEYFNNYLNVQHTHTHSQCLTYTYRSIEMFKLSIILNLKNTHTHAPTLFLKWKYFSFLHNFLVNRKSLQKIKKEKKLLRHFCRCCCYFKCNNMLIKFTSVFDCFLCFFCFLLTNPYNIKQQTCYTVAQLWETSLQNRVWESI